MIDHVTTYTVSVYVSCARYNRTYKVGAYAVSLAQTIQINFKKRRRQKESITGGPHLDKLVVTHSVVSHV
jgi:hypothetical protein